MASHVLRSPSHSYYVECHNSDGIQARTAQCPLWLKYDYLLPCVGRGEELESMFFFFQAEDGIRDYKVTGVQTCALPILIAFWYEDLEKAKAGMKAFVVNRFGDFGFIIGLFVLFWSLAGAWAPQTNRWVPVRGLAGAVRGTSPTCPASRRPACRWGRRWSSASCATRSPTSPAGWPNTSRRRPSGACRCWR